MSQREHRMQKDELTKLWIGGMPYVKDERGFLVPIPAGGSDDGDGEGASGSGDGEGNEGGSGSGEGAGGANDGQDGDKGNGPVSREEYEALKARMQAADRDKNAKLSELETIKQKLQEYEDKDKSELELAQRTAEENANKAEAAEARATTAELKLGIVLANSKLDRPFRDADDVLRYIDVSDVTSDDGELDEKALESSFQALADSKPYLLLEKQEGDGDGEGEGDGNKGGGSPSGTSQNGDKNKGKGIDREALSKKYPALRRG